MDREGVVDECSVEVVWAGGAKFLRSGNNAAAANFPMMFYEAATANGEYFSGGTFNRTKLLSWQQQALKRHVPGRLTL